MIRSIQSNISDSYSGDHPFSDATIRSVVVFAIGSASAVADPESQARVRARAKGLLDAAEQETGEQLFSPGAIEAGEHFEVLVPDEPCRHRVRAVDGPLDHEAVYAVRVIGSRSWT